MGEYAIRITMAAVIAAAGAYSAWVHIKAALAAPEIPPLWKRILPGLFYFAAALLLCNVAFAPGRFMVAWLPDAAVERARGLSMPEKGMTVVLIAAAAAVLACDASLRLLRRSRGARR